MSLPSAFIQKYQTLLGTESEAFLHALSEKTAESGFRFNPLKPNAARVRRDFIAEQFQSSPYAKDGYLGSIHGNTPLHQAGYVYSQEPTASLVATIAAAKPSERVLDLCAAPGGKTTQLATSMQDQGLLIANEIMPKRASILSENVERWGLTHTVVTNHAPKELANVFFNFFDCIVVDAPCSGEGMFRKNPDAQLEWQASTPKDCAKRQREILTEAVKMLKPGGRLIYSTCTFAPEEDEEIVSFLVHTHGFEVATIDLPDVPHSHGRGEWGSTPEVEKAIRLWPHLHPGEGHFVAKLMKPNTVAAPTKKMRSFQPKAPSAEQRALIAPFESFFLNASPLTYHVIKDELWGVPSALPKAITKLRIRRFGLHLGIFKKRRFEPNFALAMALKAIEDVPTIALTVDEWAQYVHGDAIAHPGNQGWVVLTYQGMVVGFGKQVHSLIKNFYPKGLRFTAHLDH